MRIHFLLVCEGSSDQELVPHLEKLCVLLGATEAFGVAPDLRSLSIPPGYSVEGKLRACLTLEPQANLLLIHRDADSRDPTPRYTEIEDAYNSTGSTKRLVPVVPVQALEAWLLLNENIIRAVAGKPSGRATLDLPRPNRVERVANPKNKLKEALLQASALTGRRRESFKKKFGVHRRLLLQRLSMGDLETVESWIRLKRDLQREVRAICGS